MKKQLLALMMASALGAVPVFAEAKGCLKGAAIGGVAGHFAGHGVAGAAAGCAIVTTERRNRKKPSRPGNQGTNR